MNNDPELESPILTMAEGNTLLESEATNVSQDHQDSSLDMSMNKNLVTNISNELRGSRIGQMPQGNDSSLEYAVGASCFEQAAMKKGIVDGMGANIDNSEEEPIQFYSEASGVNVDVWNSSSSFSQNDHTGDATDPPESPQREIVIANTKTNNNVEDANSDELCPIDQIDRGGKTYDLCPIDQIDQIGSGGYVKEEDERQKLIITPPLGTPKRKFSPVAGTPLGKVRKMSTNVQASPELRNKIIMYGDNDKHQLEGMAPDLLTGIGRLEIRPVQTEQPHQIVSASSTQPHSAPVNITQRLMLRAGRNRTLSLGGNGKKNKVEKYANVKRSRALSLESQRRINQIFSPRDHGKKQIAKKESDTTTK